VARALRLVATVIASVEDLLVSRLWEESAVLALDNCDEVAAASAALVSVLVTRRTGSSVDMVLRSPRSSGSRRGDFGRKQVRKRVRRMIFTAADQPRVHTRSGRHDRPDASRNDRRHQVADESSEAAA
jgi:hypothetical protein